MMCVVGGECIVVKGRRHADDGNECWLWLWHEEVLSDNVDIFVSEAA